MQEVGLDPWVGKIPWRREQLPTPVFLPGESHGQRSLAGEPHLGPWNGGPPSRSNAAFLTVDAQRRRPAPTSGPWCLLSPFPSVFPQASSCFLASSIARTSPSQRDRPCAAPSAMINLPHGTPPPLPLAAAFPQSGHKSRLYLVYRLLLFSH